PDPGPGQVRIAVAASGVHLLDTVLRAGLPGPTAARAELPTIPGREVAGTVEALGEGVDEGWLGRRVVAHLGNVPGGYAELAVTATSRLHDVPEALDEAAAVAMIGTGRTTLGIVQFADLGKGDIALVPASAGGIGTLLVQYAKNAGAIVVGLAGGPAKTEHTAANGADLAVDYTARDWPERLDVFLGGSRATVLFDSVGGDIARTLAGFLDRNGKHLVFGWSSEGPAGAPSAPRPAPAAPAPGGIASQAVLGPVMLDRAGGIRVLENRALAEAAEGRLRPAVRRVALADAAVAHRLLETRATIGKVVLVTG
ncbi:zinc-binding dehydrogenase, partial [Streptomyces sp. 8L]|uniref:zinc-binding dehydrogenase n=1 Tax=Streptomyces sp. 8L TaxID=2877242 RepID=UPI001CD309B2